MKKYFFYKCLKMLGLISKNEYKKRTAIYTREYKLLSRSKLFDKKWYAKAYPQINASALSPIEHYISNGFKEAKMPSKDFDAQKIFASPPNYFYGLYEKKNAKAYLTTHKIENKINNFSFSQKKILLFSHEFSLSGAPRALLNMAKVLRAQGIEAIFLSPSFGDLEKELQENNFEYYVEPLLMMKLLFQEEKLKNFFSSFDCIVFNSLSAIQYSVYVQSKAKRIAWVHEAYYGYSGQNEETLRLAFATMETVYSVSPYAKTFTDKYVHKDKSKVLTLYIEKKTVDLQKSQEKAKTKQFTFALVGAISEVKGHDIFLDAVSILPQCIKKECDFRLVGSLGRNKFALDIQKRAKAEGFTCTGALDYEKTLEEIAQSDVIVCASRDESLSMVTIEAMMLKKAIISSNTTGASYYLKDEINAFILDLSKEKLCDSMIKVYNSRDSLAQLAENAHEIYLKNFTKEEFAKEVKKIFAFFL